jgi:ATP-dependent helicase/nuclease subunit A
MKTPTKAFRAAANGAEKDPAMTAFDQANAQQRAASNPATSAFVAASAGSGKTKLLTDRLLRLMLTGTPPQKILCLTYTKAAATEMANRLNRRLGEWVALPDATLDAKLTELAISPTQTTRTIARKLFADVLDLPGGMRINTIHAFCQSLLRRFPLEAELSPHFELEDEFDATLRLRESRERVLANPTHKPVIASLAAETNEQDFAALSAKFCAETQIQALLRDFGRDGVVQMQRAALGANELDESMILLRAVTWPGETDIRAAMSRIADAGPPQARLAALARLDWLAADPASRATNWAAWQGSFFGDKKPYAMSKLIGPKLAESSPNLCAAVEAEQTRIAAIEDARKTAVIAALNAGLVELLAPILQSDAARKSERATVTYSDLIAVTLRLLKSPEDVAWILYKLDGGIDHLLLDEVQDTAPEQWQITEAIAGEFFAGAAARDVKRSIFAVGDRKQSIFSFQGADLRSFESYREKFGTLVTQAGETWLHGQLSVSFRSTEPVLSLVDAVFSEGAACNGVCTPGTLSHSVSRTGQAGSVTLWPLTQATEPLALAPWAMPHDYASAESSKAILARQIAAHIKTALVGGEKLPSRNRAVTPGDFLILVRRRDELVTAITRACKAVSIPIAGLDRIVLTEHQAVSDLLALCDALLLPEDDLAFAQYLASPLGGLSDESLMALALGRHGPLSVTLFARRNETPDWQAADAFFQALRARVDYVSPYGLLAEALGPLGGRAKLLQRLGAEAAEPIDELLSEALAHASRAPASLQTFVFTLRQSGASIKREASSGGDMVRIMTIHGAKGLEAPIVILPDTTTLPQPRDTLFWLNAHQQNISVPIFCPRADLRAEAIRQAAADNTAAQIEEYNRLLYVALTRAEDQLIICGAEGRRTAPENCWYNSVGLGFAKLPAETGADGAQHYALPQTAKPDRESTRALSATFTLPEWAGGPPDWRAAPPAQETARPEPLAPSRNTDDPAKSAIAASPLGDHLATSRLARAAAMERGRIVHALLQHLPDIFAPDRQAAGAKYLAQFGLALTPADQEKILAAVLNILENTSLAPLFGPGSRAEVPLAGVLGDVEIGGLVDRLAIGPEKIHIADYKTNRAPPAAPEAIPPAYLGQLAAYRAILQQIFPNRPVDCILIWTETATIMPVPPSLLARHAPEHPQPSGA